MSTTVLLVDGQGLPIALENRLASGGEGTVYTIRNDPTRLAKVYNNHASSEIYHKLTVMISLANPRLLKLAAWPSGILYDSSRHELKGFLMPRFDRCLPVQRLFNPIQRFKHFPKAAWDFQVRVAYNIAAAFAELHKVGCVIGDVNESNILVAEDATVRVIDCDSFQICANGKAFLCEMGKPEYLPPELHNKHLRSILRTINHDCFGLAVLIYQLLFVGKHPYQGSLRGVSGDPTLPQLIAEYRFSQGPLARTWGMAPPPLTPTFRDIPDELGNLFRRAFEPGSEKDARPRPDDWLSALRALERGIATCARHPGHKYWSGAMSCVWCRFADQGADYYFGVGGSLHTFAVDEAAIQDIIRRLEVITRTHTALDRTRLYAGSPPSPQPLPAILYELWNKCQSIIHKHKAMASNLCQQEKIEAEQIALRRKQLQFTLEKELSALQASYDGELKAALQSVEKARSARRSRNAGLALLLVACVFITMLALVDLHYGVIGGCGGLIVSSVLIINNLLGFISPGEQRVRQVQAAFHRIKQEKHMQLQAHVKQWERERDMRLQQLRVTVHELERAVREAKNAYENAWNQELIRRQERLAQERVILNKYEACWHETESRHKEVLRSQVQTVYEYINKCRSLGTRYDAELQQLIREAEKEARSRHLRLHQIADATIPNIGARRKQILEDYGIVSAADVEYERIIEIPGFGDALASNLLDWKDSVLQDFRFDAKRDVAPDRMQKLVATYAKYQNDCLSRIKYCMREIELATAQCERDLAKLEEEIKAAAIRYRQAEADVAYMMEHR